MEEISKPAKPEPWQFRRQSNGLVPDRMEERQAASMERNDTLKGVNGTVFGITINGVAVMSELDSELVLTSGLRAQLHQTKTLVTGTAREVKQRLARPGGVRFDDLHTGSGIVLRYPVLQTSRRGDVHSLDHGPVGLFDGAFPKLLRQPRRRLARPSEQKYSGDGFVQTMDDAQKHIAGFVVLVLEISLDGTIKRFFATFKVGTGHTCRLGNRQAVIVFVQDL